MTFVFCVQNLTHIFWTIIVSLNLYVLLLLYRISKQYRAERTMKLLATSSLTQNIEFMRCHWQRTLPTANVSITSNPIPEETVETVCQISEASDTSIRQLIPQTVQEMLPSNQNKRAKAINASTQSSSTVPMVGDERLRHPRLVQKSQHRRQELLMKRNNSHMKNINSCLSMSTSPSDVSQAYTPNPEDEHMLYISDSSGRVVHEIPFRECDYVDALYTVLDNPSARVERCE